MTVENSVQVVSPKVGDSVAVLHKSSVDAAGHPQGKLHDAKLYVDHVKAVYMDGDVRVTSGDAWSVVPATDGKTKWKTVKNK